MGLEYLSLFLLSCILIALVWIIVENVHIDENPFLSIALALAVILALGFTLSFLLITAWYFLS